MFKKIPTITFAARNNQSEIIEILLQYGADINIQAEKSKATPLFEAVRHAASNAIETLIQHQADAAIPNKKGKTPLHDLALKSRSKLGTRLYSYASTVLNSQDNDGNTPLHLSVKRGSKSFTKFLLDSGADPSIANYTQQTPYKIAELTRNKWLMNLLQEHMQKKSSLSEDIQ